VIGAKVIALLLAAALAGSHGPAPAPHPPQAAKPLAGKVVGIDPGHNGGNFSAPSFINHLVWNGREQEACDTTGTETNGGYTEARFNFNVAMYLRRELLREGAKVVMTRRTNHGVGPCIDRRAQILDRARADVAIDIHADGGPAGGRGVAILTPVPAGPNDKVIASSKRFGRILLHRYTKLTGIPVSNYDGTDGFAPRANLAGLNLTTVPKVLIECVNMRNPADAARLVKPAFQRRAAKSMAEAITAFLRPHQAAPSR
jgi:N-acetylmuramoyl-L-alanine amidase